MKFNDDDIEVPGPEKTRAREKKFVKGAASTRQLADENLDSTKPVRTRKKKDVRLEQVSIKLHPDVIKAVNMLAEDQRKMPAEILRDLVLKGLRSQGAEIPRLVSHPRTAES